MKGKLHCLKMLKSSPSILDESMGTKNGNNPLRTQSREKQQHDPEL